MPPSTIAIEPATASLPGRQYTCVVSRNSSFPAASVGAPIWKPNLVIRSVSFAAPPGTLVALATITIAPWVTMVVVVVGGSVVVVVVLDVVVGAAVVVVVSTIVEAVVAGSVSV